MCARQGQTASSHRMRLHEERCSLSTVTTHATRRDPDAPCLAHETRASRTRRLAERLHIHAWFIKPYSFRTWRTHSKEHDPRLGSRHGT